ncbi:S41 family peptidase [Chryseobacterium terrae]|uniref:S41 family peptidase n=1 Tax=Chryseobacterium terrae TaxID=3163299 RepID=A0ABW8Y6H3_9FLAO
MNFCRFYNEVQNSYFLYLNHYNNNMLNYNTIKSFFLLILLLSYSSLYSQSFKNDSVRSFVNTSIDLIRSNAVDTSKIKLIKSALYGKAKDLNSISELAPLYTEVFKLLNDHHGSLKYKGKTYGWSKAAVEANVYLKGKLKTEKSVLSTTINKSIGYIRIPGNSDFAFMKVDSIANDITSHINKVNSPKIKESIIDLRLNTGGNMYPFY